VARAGHARILRVARTVADLVRDDDVATSHIGRHSVSEPRAAQARALAPL